MEQTRFQNQNVHTSKTIKDEAMALMFCIPLNDAEFCSKCHENIFDGSNVIERTQVAISVSPHVCFILVLILISMFLR